MLSTTLDRFHRVILPAAVTAVLASGAAVPAFAGYATGVDQGTILSPAGIVPIPGQGAAPYWGGNTLSKDGRAFTAIAAGGKSHAVLDGLNGDFDLTHALNAAYGTNVYVAGGVLGIEDVDDGQIGVVGWAATCAKPGTTCQPQPIVWANSATELWSVPLMAQGAGAVGGMAQAIAPSGNIAGWVEYAVPGQAAPTQSPELWEPGAPGLDLPMPANFSSAAATTISETTDGQLNVTAQTICGYGTSAIDKQTHAVCWPYSVVAGAGWDWIATDVTPPGDTAAVIMASDPKSISGGAAGSVLPFSANAQYHAAYWPTQGQANAVDLHPANLAYVNSSAYAMRVVRGTAVEAGLASYKARSGQTRWHAMAWNSTAQSALDLHTLLPAGKFVQSTAAGIDENGNIEGAAQDANGVWHAVYWARL